MPDIDHILPLIGDIYDAALDPARWSGVLEKIAMFVGGPATALVSQDVASRTGGFYYSWGDDPYYTKLYFEKYVRLNPTLVPLALLGVGQVRSLSNFFPFDVFRRTRLYREWAKPQGYGDATIAVLEKSSTTTVHLTIVHRDCDSPVHDDTRQCLAVIAPHMRRAVAIARIIDLHKIEAAMLAEAVDAIAAGVFLVTEDGSVVHANASGRSMLDVATIVRLERGHLTATSTDARVVLRDGIAAASKTDVAWGHRQIAIPLPSREPHPYVAYVLPLSTGVRWQARLRYAATAAVFVHKAAIDGPTPIEAIAHHFRLTPTELRVLIAIVEVGGAPEVASMLGIAETTVKTHLRHLFEKTGASRQADLVKIVAGFANPLFT